MRLFCHMVVGPGEAERYLEPVLDRAGMWADYVHVTLDAYAGDEEQSVVSHYADGWERTRLSWEDHEGMFRADAWMGLELCGPTTDDFIVCLDADEVIVDHAMVRPAAHEYPGYAIPFRFHEMWDLTHYRTDGYWRPYAAGIMFPYREYGHFTNKALACGREPTYVKTLPLARVVGNILHYGYADPDDRRSKHQRYMRLDGGRYHARSHLDSILADRVSLEEWTKGGLLV